MRAFTGEEALKIYHAGPEATIKILCELSTTIKHLKRRIKAIENRLAQNIHWQSVISEWRS